LSNRGIDSGVYYPGTLPEQPCFTSDPSNAHRYPVAESAAMKVLALPVHHRLQEGDPTRVVASLADIFVEMFGK